MIHDISGYLSYLIIQWAIIVDPTPDTRDGGYIHTMTNSLENVLLNVLRDDFLQSRYAT